MQDVSFESLALKPEILSALQEEGYSKPTDIQAAAIPVALKGRDIMATAQTGTGKTAAFSLPLLHQMSELASNEKDGTKKRKLRALILSPTRELAQQIEASITAYSKNLSLNVLSVVGGLPIQKQIGILKSGVDILVATPGRLLDLMQRRAVDLRDVEYFVLDEADRMLDMGFVFDVKDIAKKLRKERQTLLFSATTSNEVKNLSRILLNDPETIAVDLPQSVADRVEQKVMFVAPEDKRQLVEHILSTEKFDRALIFTETKSNANVLSAVLGRKGFKTDAIHSDKNQKVRQQTLQAFDEGKIEVLIATNVMARGIDIEGISHVINYELPNEAENFVHRLGRTARAGSSGKAISLCDRDEIKLLRSIESFTGEEIEIDRDHPFHSPLVETMKNQRVSPFGSRKRKRKF